MSKNYKIVKSWKEIKQIAKWCKETKYCCIDFETNGEPPTSKEFFPTIVGISFQIGSAYVIPMGHKDSKFKDEYPKILQYLSKHVFENPDIIKVAWNMKFEHKILMRYDCNFKGRCFDGMLAKYILNEERPNDLKSMVRRFIPEFSDYEDEVVNLKKEHGSWADIPIKELSEYCALDCDLELRLMVYFESKLMKAKLYSLYRNLLMMDSRVLAESEFNGLVIDKPYLDKLVKSYAKRLVKLDDTLRNHKILKSYEKNKHKRNIKDIIKDTRKEIEKLREDGGSDRMIQGREEKVSRYIAGNFTTKKELKLVEPFNFNSPNQLIDLFFSEEGFDFEVVKYTKDQKTKKETDRPSTDEEVLQTLGKKDKTGFVIMLLEFRKVAHLNSTYVEGMSKRVTSENKVHGSFLIHGTVTGRLSSRDPNLQNIPRDTTAPEIKKMFIPPQGYVLMEVDYSQAELRIVADISDEKVMINWFKTGKNVHVATACKMNDAMDRYDEIFAITKNEDHKEHVQWMKRKKAAKLVNFGMLYGETAKKLSGQLGTSERKAQKFMDDWFRTFPNLTKHIKGQHKLAYKNGFVKNRFGRKRRLPDIYRREEKFGAFLEAQRQSVNAPIQGESSDFTQFSSVVVRERKMNGYLPIDMVQVYTVHDSIGYYIRPECIHEVAPKMLEICSNPEVKKYFGFEMNKVKMSINVEIGKNWGELRGYNNDEDYTRLLEKTIE